MKKRLKYLSSFFIVLSFQSSFVNADDCLEDVKSIRLSGDAQTKELTRKGKCSAQTTLPRELDDSSLCYQELCKTQNQATSSQASIKELPPQMEEDFNSFKENLFVKYLDIVLDELRIYHTRYNNHKKDIDNYLKKNEIKVHHYRELLQVSQIIENKLKDSTRTLVQADKIITLEPIQKKTNDHVENTLIKRYETYLNNLIKKDPLEALNYGVVDIDQFKKIYIRPLYQKIYQILKIKPSIFMIFTLNDFEKKYEETMSAQNNNELRDKYQDFINMTSLYSDEVFYEKFSLLRPNSRPFLCSDEFCVQYFKEIYQADYVNPLKEYDENKLRQETKKVLNNCKFLWYRDYLALQSEKQISQMKDLMNDVLQKVMNHYVLSKKYSTKTQQNLKSSLSKVELLNQPHSHQTRSESLKMMLRERINKELQIAIDDDFDPITEMIHIKYLSHNQKIDPLAPLREICLSSSAQFEISDFVQSRENGTLAMYISPFSLTNQSLGLQIMSHEFGHLISILLAQSPSKRSPESYSIFTKERNCITNRHPLKQTAHPILHLGDLISTEEEHADLISFITNNRVIGPSQTPLKCQAFMGQQELQREENLDRPHPPLLLRTVLEAKVKGLPIPKSCQSWMNSLDYPIQGCHQ